MKTINLALLFIIYSLFMLGNARRIELQLRNRHKKLNVVTFPSVPEFRALNNLPDEDYPSPIEDDEEDDYQEPVFAPTANVPSRKKLLLIKGKSNEINSGRTFKHLLLLRGLGETDGGSSGGGIPSIFYLYNPVTLNNTNNNTLLNDQPAAATAAGTRGSGIIRDTRPIFISPSQALPQPIRVAQPTPVYEQRNDHQQHSSNSQMPFNSKLPALVGMLGQNGDVIPMVLPNLDGDFQSLLAASNNRRNNQRKRGGGNRFRTTSSIGNPFMGFNFFQ